MLSTRQEDVSTTWFGDVAPLFARSCWSCHLADDPVPLVTLEQGRAFASESLAIAGTRRTAHPVVVDDTGRCRGVGPASAPLSPAELETLERWIASGTPAGDPADGPTPPVSALTGRGERLISYPLGWLPHPGDVSSHCFVLPPADLAEDVFVVGFEVRGGAGLVRLAGLLVNNEEGQDLAVALDAADATPGYACGPDTREPDAPPIVDASVITRFAVSVAAPGLPDDVFPPTQGVRARAGLGFVARVDFLDGVDADGDEDISLQMAVSSQVQRETSVIVLVDEVLAFPAGRSHVSSPTPEVRPTAEVVGAAAIGGPRLVGAGIQTEDECVLELGELGGLVGRTVILDAPIPAGETVSGWCVHDTTTATSDLLFGPSPAGESCILGLFVDLGAPP